MFIVNMVKLIDNVHYEIVSPVSGLPEVWTGERIKAYQTNYKADVEMYEEPVVRSTPKKRTRKTKK